MNAVAETTTAAAARVELREPRPSFFGAMRGEILKLSRQTSIWAMLGLALLLFLVVTLALFQANGVKANAAQHPDAFVFNMYDVYLALFDTGAGILLLIVTARLVGMEYSAGTIRVLLARGSGRLRLLFAKLTALALLGVILLAGFLVLAVGALYLVVLSWHDSALKFSSLPGHVWTDLGINVGIALVSVVVCILLGTAAAVLGRSLAFGIAAALAFFPADNFLAFILNLLHAATNWHVWLDISAYLLGPNLNALPSLLQTDHAARAAFATPLIKVDATHAWLVIGAWALAFVLVSAGLTRRRDVLQ